MRSLSPWNEDRRTTVPTRCPSILMADIASMAWKFQESASVRSVSTALALTFRRPAASSTPKGRSPGTAFGET